ncbi:hypothetical protein Bca101_091782 [Brassica carinata]
MELGVLSWRLEADHYETDEELKKIRESRVVKDDTFRKHLRGCEFWFDFRTDVLEEGFQIERYCELVWTILNEKKQVAEILELDKDVASSGSVDIGGSSDSETAANDAITVEVKDGDTPCSHVFALASKIDEAEEHSCSSLVTQQVFDPIQQATKSKSPSAINP